MLLKSIKLSNIRSYLNQEIRFPEGSLLLAGDIGSGKSTILLAVEFALFGFKGKSLSGHSLLRNGKNNGSVELNFDIDGKNVIIKRALKRYKDDIKQEAGYIIIDNMKTEATPVELKTKILEFLGYPKELLSKSKDLIYRYTVYTPQEEMKKILTDEDEVRLDILRRVFGIDKYKKIKENITNILMKDLREKAKEMEGKISDLEEKKKQKEHKEEEIKTFSSELNEISSKLNLLKEKLNEKKSNLLEAEKNLQKLNELKNKLSNSEIHLKNNKQRSQQNAVDIEKLKENISNIKNEIKGKEHFLEENFANLLLEKEKRLDTLEKEISMIKKSSSEMEATKNISSSLKKKIQELNKCPTCLQDVSHEHKHSINERETKNILEFEKSISANKEQEKKIEKLIFDLKKEISELRIKDKESALIKFKKQSIDEKIKGIDELLKNNETIKEGIEKINSEMMLINKSIEELKNIDDKYKKLKEEHDIIASEERKKAIEENTIKTKIDEANKQIIFIQKDIDLKLKIKETLSYTKEIYNWFDSYFLNLMDLMERHVMSKIHHEFNELFQEWFNILMEDETINVRLDEQFSPIVQQNSYDIDVSYLSGGEKTSCALAYRLSLNKVINDLIIEIKTKDIIILDEPTDGFSSEQLDKVRNVLDLLNMKQVIIVSHETKIESFVDSIIRVNKSEHVSEITA